MKILRFLVKWLGFLFGFMCALVVAMALGGPLGFPFELFMSWPFMVSAIGLGGALMLVLTGWARCAIGLAAAAIVVSGWAILAPSTSSPVRATALADTQTSTLIWGNSLGQIHAIDELIARSKAQAEPTIVSIGEMPRQWQPNPLLEQNLARTTGLGVLGCGQAGIPMRNQGYYGPNRNRRTFALQVQCQEYTLFAVHLTNPLWGRGVRFARRGEEIALLAQAVSAVEGPVVVIGDFNAAPHAPPLMGFAKTAKLKRAQCGSLWTPTWRPLPWRNRVNARNPFTGIPIDHVFARDIDITSCDIGPDFGSDHLPLFVKLQARGDVE